VQSQFSVVSGPRNHLYRTGRLLVEDGPFGFALCERQPHHAGDFAGEFDLEAIFDRLQLDALDETAQEAERLVAGRGIGQGLVQILDLAPVDLGQARMQTRRRRRRLQCRCPLSA
jgi:hypothetical protein